MHSYCSNEIWKAVVELKAWYKAHNSGMLTELVSCFLLTSVQYTSKILFLADLSMFSFILDINKQLLMINIFILSQQMQFLL